MSGREEGVGMAIDQVSKLGCLFRLEEEEKVTCPRHCPESPEVPAKPIPAAILVPVLGGRSRAHAQNSARDGLRGWATRSPFT